MADPVIVNDPAVAAALSGGGPSVPPPPQWVSKPKPAQDFSKDIAAAHAAAAAIADQPNNDYAKAIQDAHNAAVEQQLNALKAKSSTGIIPQVGELARSAGEGLAGMAELPGLASAGVYNAANWALGKPFAPAPYAHPFVDKYNELLPPNYNYPVTRLVGSVAGPAALEAVATLGGSIPATAAGVASAIPRVVARTGVTTGETLLGSEAGGLAGESAFGPGGRVPGQIIGGGLATAVPAIVSPAVTTAGRSLLLDESSAGRAEILRRAGIDINLDQIGNPLASKAATFAQFIPGAGNRITNARNVQNRQLFENLQGVAAERRGGPAGNISPSTIGEQAGAAATTAANNIGTAQSQLYDPLNAQVGMEAVDPNPEALRTHIDQAGSRAAPGNARNTIQRWGNTFDTAAGTPYPAPFGDVLAGPPKVADTANETMLQSLRSQLETSISNTNDPTLRQTLQDRLDTVNADIGANRGLNWNDQRTYRADLRNELQGTRDDYNKNALLKIKRGLDAATTRTAEAQGVSPDRLRQINLDNYNLERQNELLDPFFRSRISPEVGGQPGPPIPKAPGKTYKALFSSPADKTPILNVLKEHVPADQMNRMMADRFEMMTLGPNRGLAGVPEPVPSPRAGILEQWQNTPEEYRTAMAGDATTNTRARAGANIEAGEQMAERARNPGGINPYALATRAVTGLAAPAAAALGLSLPLSLTAGGALWGLGHYASRLLTDPNVARRLLNPESAGMQIANNLSLSQLLAGAIGGPRTSDNPTLDELIRQGQAQ